MPYSPKGGIGQVTIKVIYQPITSKENKIHINTTAIELLIIQLLINYTLDLKCPFFSQTLDMFIKQ